MNAETNNATLVLLGISGGFSYIPSPQWGIASFAIVPPLQMRVMEAAADAPNLASAMNIGAFNLGNAIGAALGGGVIGAGLGLPAVSLAGAAMAAAALVMLLAIGRRRTASCPA